MSSQIVKDRRVSRGTKIVLDSPAWDEAPRAAGRLLRLYKYPIDHCVNEEQRQGWLAEDRRIECLLNEV